MLPNPVNRPLVVLFLLLVVFEAQVEGDVKCNLTDIHVRAAFKYKDMIYALSADMVSKVSGFRNGLPVLDVTSPVTILSLWPDLTDISKEKDWYSAFSRDPFIYFFNNKKEVSKFEGFKFISTQKVTELIPYLKGADRAAKKEWELRWIYSAAAVKDESQRIFITLLTCQIECDQRNTLKQCLRRLYYVEQMYIYEDFRTRLKGKVMIPKTRANDNHPSYLFTPSALLTLGFERKTNQMLVFYGSIWSPTDFSMNEGENYFDFDPKVDYKLSNHWMGCPQVFCWEADVDAVTKLTDGSLHVFRGAFVWTLDQWPPTSLPSAPKKITEVWPETGGYLDAALTIKGVTYLFKDMTVYRIVSDVVQKGEKRTKLFKDSPDGGLDAASLYQQGSVDNIAYLFQGFYFWEYSITNDKFSFQKKNKLTLLKGLPKNIDGAYSSGDQRLMVFKGSFYYDAKTDSKFDPILSQTKAICKDTFYSSISWRIDGLLKTTTYDKFVAYRLQFEPKALNDSKIPPETTTTVSTLETTSKTEPSEGPSGATTTGTGGETLPATGTTPNSPTDSFGFLWILLIVALLMAVILGAFFVWFFMKKKKDKESAPKSLSSKSPPESQPPTSSTKVLTPGKTSSVLLQSSPSSGQKSAPKPQSSVSLTKSQPPTSSPAAPTTMKIAPVSPQTGQNSTPNGQKTVPKQQSSASFPKSQLPTPVKPTTGNTAPALLQPVKKSASKPQSSVGFPKSQPPPSSSALPTNGKKSVISPEPETKSPQTVQKSSLKLGSSASPPKSQLSTTISNKPEPSGMK